MKTRGFTLLELLIAVIIIGVLGGVALSHFGQARERAILAEADAGLNKLAEAALVFLEVNNRWPANANAARLPNAGLEFLPGQSRYWSYRILGSNNAGSRQRIRVRATAIPNRTRYGGFDRLEIRISREGVREYRARRQGGFTAYAQEWPF